MYKINTHNEHVHVSIHIHVHVYTCTPCIDVHVHVHVYTLYMHVYIMYSTLLIGGASFQGHLEGIALVSSPTIFAIRRPTLSPSLTPSVGAAPLMEQLQQ